MKERINLDKHNAFSVTYDNDIKWVNQLTNQLIILIIYTKDDLILT